MTASLRPIIADILRDVPTHGPVLSHSVIWHRERGANLLDYIEATEQVDLLEECQDELARVNESHDELEGERDELRDRVRKLKVKNDELKSEVEGRRVVMDELGLIDY